jgi:hypothetical protein
MEDFDRTPFKNRDISRLTGNTTTPTATSFRNARDARNGNTPEQRANAAAKKSSKNTKNEYENMKKDNVLTGLRPPSRN